MTTLIFSLDELDTIDEIEHDWLFEKLLGKLNANRHLILSAGPGRDQPAALPGLKKGLKERKLFVFVLLSLKTDYGCPNDENKIISPDYLNHFANLFSASSAEKILWKLFNDSYQLFPWQAR